MSLVTRSYDFVNGTIADGDQVDTEFNTLYAVINGNLDDANIKVGAGIQGGKLAAGSVTGTQLANNSVDNNKLKSDGAIDVNRAVTTDHIRDGAVTQPKIAADAVQAANVKFSDSADLTQNVNALATLDSLVDTGINRTSFPIAFVIMINDASSVDFSGISLVLNNDGTANWKVRVRATNNAVGLRTLHFKLRYISGVVHP